MPYCCSHWIIHTSVQQDPTSCHTVQRHKHQCKPDVLNDLAMPIAVHTWSVRKAWRIHQHVQSRASLYCRNQNTDGNYTCSCWVCFPCLLPSPHFHYIILMNSPCSKCQAAHRAKAWTMYKQTRRDIAQAITTAPQVEWLTNFQCEPL